MAKKARKARDTKYTWVGLLAIGIAAAAIAINLGQLNIIGIVVVVIIGALMYNDSGKKKFNRDEQAWLFAFGVLCGIIGAIAYLITRPRKGKKPVMRWMMWIVLTVILFAAGIWLASIPGFATF